MTEEGKHLVQEVYMHFGLDVHVILFKPQQGEKSATERKAEINIVIIIYVACTAHDVFILNAFLSESKFSSKKAVFHPPSRSDYPCVGPCSS